MGALFFYLRKNSTTGNNLRFTIINTSVPYKSYKLGANGLQLENGYKYRPALRMQFIPVMQNTDPTITLRPWLFPTTLKIMKKDCYSDDIFGDSVLTILKLRPNNISDWILQTDIDITKVFNSNSCSSNDIRKNNLMHGIAFHLYVAYDLLNIRFQYLVSTSGKVLLNIYVYNADASAILYQGYRLVTLNYNVNPLEYGTRDNKTDGYVVTDLHYVYPKTTSTFTLNHVYATLYIKKLFYLLKGRLYNYLLEEVTDLYGKTVTKNIPTFIAENKQYLITVRFKNFVADLNDGVKNVVVTNSLSLNGVYLRNGTIKNGKSVYYNPNTMCYIYNVIDASNNAYWVFSNIILDDHLDLNISDVELIVLCASELVTTETNKWRYTIGLNLSSSSSLSSFSSSLLIDYDSTNIPIVSYVTILGVNSLQLNYQRQDVDGCMNLFNSIGGMNTTDNNLYYYILSAGNYRWIYDKKLLKDAIFTRTLTTSLTDNTIKGIPYTTTKLLLNFYVNRPSLNQTSFTIYLDYLKKIQTLTGLLNFLILDIKDYLNQLIIVSVLFNTWGKAGSNLQHDISTHYNYAFGHVDDYYKSSSKSLYLLYDEGNIPFLINGLENKKHSDTSVSYLNGVGFPKYINYKSVYYANVKECDNYDLDENIQLRRVIKYRYSLSLFKKDDSDQLVPWRLVYEPVDIPTFEQVTSILNANILIGFADNQNNTKQVFLQVADNLFNVSLVAQGNLTVYTTEPSSTFIKITGTNGGTNYTGVYIDDLTQQFTVDNKIMVQFSAYSDIGLFYKITGDVYTLYLNKDEDGNLVLQKLDEYVPFDASNNILNLLLIPLSLYTPKALVRQYNNDGSLKDTSLKKLIVTDKGLPNTENKVDKSLILSYAPLGILNANNKKQITVTFRDLAGNVQSITGTIVLNTRLFETDNRNLRLATSTYDLQVYKTANNINTLIARTDTKKSSTTRNWRDIFYPLTHGYPTLANGDIDVTLTNKITLATDYFDPVVRNNGSIVYDEQGRTTTIWSNRKKYPTMVSSFGDISNEYSGFVYWIIDNKGFGDISLQFEHFYLDTVAYGPPYNQNLGQRPDALIVYDASLNGCVLLSINLVGLSTYTLIDTTKLKQLQVYSGSGANTMSLLTGTVNATAQGLFTTLAFATLRLCLIFYSDYRNSTDSATSPIGSGFKIKAAKQIVLYWQNFDVDSTNGLIWVHTSSDNLATAPSGLSVDDVKMTYDYYSTNLQIDYDLGSVIFDLQPKDKNGNPTDVYATYTYYTYDAKDRPPVRTFLLDADDLVDYADVNLYYLPNGTTPIKVGTTAPIYKDTNNDGKGEYSTYSAGKLNNYFFIDKDRGVVLFNNGVSLSQDLLGLVPRGRIFADYRYHSFDRLGNDGYSDFEFNDSMLIAGITTQYPDYTWGDVKIVNLGDALLRDGKLVFLARGQVENNVITSVLDYDRPWDVQLGTAELTYDKVAIVIRKNYAWNSYACTRLEAKNLYKTADVNTFPDVMKAKLIFYGRIVYCLGGSNDSYPTTTAGRKTFSSEISGRFIQVD